MALSRRDFIKHVSSASLVMLGGNVINLTPADAAELRKNSLLRFVVASDGHYGQAGTESDSFYQTLIKHVTDFHANNTLDFCVINGDVIHDGKELLTPAKQHLDKLPVKYYVTKGNHDIVSDQYWNEVWGMPVNHDVQLKKNTLLLATTSNEKGEYLSPDLEWMKEKLDANKKQDNVFIFIHIPQAKWTKNGIETPAFFELLQKYTNVRGVFHGHEHDQDGVKMVKNIPFMFDAHFGGSWGTSYRGFRVVELVKEKSFLTYIMNPIEKINQAAF
ncbi:metallophosphoesterase [Chryseolinea sp. H1M3-3]|uniref:metallophosphoesterase family protein n=1 Tax=Chryseolinea sp. H1M3-3 TaxID=3034144 RepID=UPI0023ED2DD0|nr:metallophosphoesterase [Chryseolinea sp. H1M3-3]